MKYKWIAVLLACALLLCGCRQAETGGSVTPRTDTTVTTLTHVTDADTTTTESTSVFAKQTRSSTVSDTQTVRTSSDPYATAYFRTWDAYGEALQGVHTAKDLAALFSADRKKVANMPMLLKDDFYLLPQPQNLFFDSVTFTSKGYSKMTPNLEDGCHAGLVIDHSGKNGAEENEGKGYEKIQYTTDQGIPITRYISKTDVLYWTAYYMEVEGYSVFVSTHYDCDCIEDFVNTLTFEKVEIK